MREKVGIYMKSILERETHQSPIFYFYDLNQVTRGPIHLIVWEEKNFTLLLLGVVVVTKMCYTNWHQLRT